MTNQHVTNRQSLDRIRCDDLVFSMKIIHRLDLQRRQVSQTRSLRHCCVHVNENCYAMTGGQGVANIRKEVDIGD